MVLAGPSAAVFCVRTPPLRLEVEPGVPGSEQGPGFARVCCEVVEREKGELGAREAPSAPSRLFSRAYFSSGFTETVGCRSEKPGRYEAARIELLKL